MFIYRRFWQTTVLLQQRCFHKLIYEKYGNPLEVLSIVSCKDTQHISESMAKVRVLMAPINPADINTIQGLYPIRPTLPAVPGGECVAEIISGIKFNKGDRVIVLELGWGTWKEEGLINEKHLYKVPDNLSDYAAATLSVNPCTAFRMLQDFVVLKPGDVVIQNGANSAVGQFVIQLCKINGVKTVNIIRDRPDTANLKSYLSGLGADLVLTEEEFSKDIFKLKEMSLLPALALNCVGGRSAVNLSRALQKGGCLVTYGGMSKQPVTLPTGHFIFQDVKAYGFWMSRWKTEHECTPEYTAMLQCLIGYVTSGKLQLPDFAAFPLFSWDVAIQKAMKGFTTQKGLFQMSSEENLVYCYNKGCKHKKFDPTNNPTSSIECVYHPGAPIFHDAMKIWSCCNKKSHDFTEFLDIKGCKSGPHNPTKPTEPAKPTEKHYDPLPKMAPSKKPVEEQAAKIVESRLIDLPITVSATLRDALAKLDIEMKNHSDEASARTCDAKVIEKGAPCKNRGCNKTYQSVDDDTVEGVDLADEEDDSEDAPKGDKDEPTRCLFHPGVPVFHEGMKFWSCCQRKTTEFDVFLGQEGCEVGDHNWLHKGEKIVKHNACRSDFHQTTNTLTLNFYAKMCDPKKCSIRASGTELDVHLEFEAGSSTFDRRFQLFGTIDPSRSSVKFGAKVEVVLSKLDKLAWPRLEYSPPHP